MEEKASRNTASLKYAFGEICSGKYYFIERSEMYFNYISIVFPELNTASPKLAFGEIRSAK
jgi:hypothetical protein